MTAAALLQPCHSFAMAHLWMRHSLASVGLEVNGKATVISLVVDAAAWYHRLFVSSYVGTTSKLYAGSKRGTCYWTQRTNYQIL